MTLMTGLADDFRAALRLVLRRPAFAAVIVLTLAVSVGATTSVFSVVRGLLLAPLPFRNPGQLVRFFGSWRQFPQGTVSLEEFREDYERLLTVNGVAAWGWGSGGLAGTGAPEHIGLGRATSSLLPVLGVRPALGRWFTKEEEEPGRGGVVVLGPSLWRRRFGADPGVVGQTVEISGRPYRIVGVLASDLELPESFDAWRPLSFPPAQGRGSRSLRVIGRLAPGATLADLRAELSLKSAQLRAAFPEVYPADAGFRMEAVPLLDQLVGRLRPTLWMLFGAVVLVLLMACANVGNLLLARGIARERELAVRAALGAGRARLVRQMLMESLFLALLGGVLGALLAVWGVDLLLARGPANLPRAAEVRVDAMVLLFGIGVALASGVVFGLLPALTATARDPEQSLRGTGASASPRPVRLRRALVAIDVALALMLVSGAALLLRSFGKIVGVDPGFQPAGAVSLTVGVPRDDATARAVFTAALQRFRELPGTVAAGGVDYQPLSGVANDQSFEVEGRPVPAGSQAADEEIRVVTPGWFEAMGIPLLRGRTLQEVEKAPVVVVNDAFARKYWPDADPIGQRIRLAGDERWWTVAGVRGDVREFGLDAAVRPTMYVPFQLAPANTLSLVVRSQAGPAEVLRQAQQVLAGIEPLATAYQARPLTEAVAASVAQRAFALDLLHGFAALSLLLAGLGLYGVLAYAVVQRRREIGVRMALGAPPAHAVALIARESGAVVGAGLLIGIAGSLASARAFTGLLFGVGPADPASLFGALAVLAAVAAVATLLPALRAAKVDPVVALRAE